MGFQNILCSAWNTKQAETHKLGRLSNTCSGHSPLPCETSSLELPAVGRCHWHSFALRPSLKKLTAGSSEVYSPPLGHMSTSHEIQCINKIYGLRPPPQNECHRHEHGICGHFTVHYHRHIKTNSLYWLESVWSKRPRTRLKLQHKTVLDWNGILSFLKGRLLWDKWSSDNHHLHFREIQEFALLERSIRLHREELKERKSYINWVNAKAKTLITHILA